MPNKRRNYFINKEFQTNFIIKFCLLLTLAGLLTIGIVYLLALASTTVSIWHSRVLVRSTAYFLLPLLIQTVAIVLVAVGLATIWVTLLVSHKIAGPLYRFKKIAQSLGEGDFSSEFKIRQSDQLQDLADEFNIMIKKVREEVGMLKNSFNILKEKLDNAASPQTPEQKSELKKICDDLSRIIGYFKS